MTKRNVYRKRISGMMFVSIVVLMLSIQMTHAQQWEATIHVTDRIEENPRLLRLGIGFHPDATDGNDGRALGDTIAPPPPPSGSFDARITNSAATDDYLTDIRGSSTSQVAFDIKYQTETGKGPIVLHWDAEKLATLGTFQIVDNITGELYGPFDMTSTDTFDVSAAGGLLDAGLRVLVVANPVSIKDDFPGLPDEQSFVLYPNFPNPFNGGTTIKFHLKQSAEVDLTIYDIVGQKISTLTSGRRNAGIYTVRWDGTYLSGNPAPSGVYFARLQSGTSQQFLKLFLIK